VSLFDMAGHLIRRMNQISTTTFHQRIKQTGYDLTPVQFAAMQTLHTNPDIEQAQIASMIAYDRATIGGVIDRLEQKGYISRIISKQDRRARECCLTQKGELVLENVSPVVESLQQEVLDGLNAEERKHFIALAQKVVNHNQEKTMDERR
jgi:MarR family transcriptional regulator, temperature-dependent positive regulator of motility